MLQYQWLSGNQVEGAMGQWGVFSTMGHLGSETHHDAWK